MSKRIFDQTDRTTLKRLPQRGEFDREEVYKILDEGFVCHVGFAVDGQPFVIPTSYGRAGDDLYIHGSAASRMLRSLTTGIPVCITVTLIDGLVLARSAFHHSVNFRSVVIFGTATNIVDPQAKNDALRTITEHIIPGRWDEVREPNEIELKGTSVLVIPLNEVSAKIRTGPPKDDDEDKELRVWAGELPFKTIAVDPVGDPYLLPEVQLPSYVRDYSRSLK